MKNKWLWYWTTNYLISRKRVLRPPRESLLADCVREKRGARELKQYNIMNTVVPISKGAPERSLTVTRAANGFNNTPLHTTHSRATAERISTAAEVPLLGAAAIIQFPPFGAALRFGRRAKPTVRAYYISENPAARHNGRKRRH